MFLNIFQSPLFAPYSSQDSVVICKMVRVEEGDIKAAQALVEQWRYQLATISESSIVRKLLEKGLSEQENTLAKVRRLLLL